MAMLYKDTAGQLDRNAGDTNLGLKARRALTSLSKPVDMITKLHDDLLQCERYIPSNVDLKIKLIRSKTAFNLIGDDAQTFKSVITQAVLYTRRIKLNPAVYMAQEKALAHSNFRYPLKRRSLQSYVISAGHSSKVFDNLYLSQIPNKILFVS